MKETISDQIEAFQAYLHKSFKAIITQIQINPSSCNCYQHQQDFFQKTSYPCEQIKMDKTLPKSVNGKQHLTSIKSNLKSLKEKYETMYLENQSFNNRVEAYLNHN